MTIKHDETAPLGLIFDEPDSIYYSTGFLGSSAIRDYVKSPRGFYKRHVIQDPLWQVNTTEAMKKGSLVDAVLTGTFEKSYVVAPKQFVGKNGALLSNKDAKAWLKEQEGKTVTTEEKYDVAINITNEVMRHPKFELVEGTHSQVTFRHVLSGVPLQGRADLYGNGMINDLKVTGEDLRWFKKKVDDFGLHIQAAFYIMMNDIVGGEKIDNYYLTVAQNKYPYKVDIFQLPWEKIDQGATMAKDAIRGIRSAIWDFSSHDIVKLVYDD